VLNLSINLQLWPAPKTCHLLGVTRFFANASRCLTVREVEE
jgi:hypothetical protein